jgi:hypothetical protein
LNNNNYEQEVLLEDVVEEDGDKCFNEEIMDFFLYEKCNIFYRDSKEYARSVWNEDLFALSSTSIIYNFVTINLQNTIGI